MSTYGGRQDNFNTKTFGAKKLDVEDVVNNAINEIMLCPLKANELGDMSKVNRLQGALVLNLDTFVRNLLESNERKKYQTYEKRRTDVIQRWPVLKDSEPGIEIIRELFGVCVWVLGNERLFKMRRMTFFAEGWEEDRRVAIEKMMDEEDKETLDQGGTVDAEPEAAQSARPGPRARQRQGRPS